MILIPDQEKLDAIKAQGYSGSVLSKQVGPYRLSCIYRECSALGAHGSWYPETQIMEGDWAKQDGRFVQWPRILWQGEGWTSFLHLANNLETAEQVETFLVHVNETDD